MSERMNQPKLVVIDEVQRIANDKFGEDAAKTTNVLLWEIRELSEDIIEHLKEWMPYTYQHYESNAPHKLSP